MSGKTLEMTMLFDFYGDMLTEKQREYFDLYYNEDLSLGEIASNVGISRQGVRDIIVRAESTLLEFEKKTGIVARFEKHSQELNSALSVAEKIKSMSDSSEIKAEADRLIALLDSMRG